MRVLVPLSIGEFLDKISILEIKAERIVDAGKLANVGVELEALRAVARAPDLARVLSGAGVRALISDLGAVNRRLWQVEDDLRDLERAQDFGAAFVRLARAVYEENDLRARLKRRLNQETGSDLVEEKSYSGT